MASGELKSSSLVEGRTFVPTLVQGSAHQLNALRQKDLYTHTSKESMFPLSNFLNSSGRDKGNSFGFGQRGGDSFKSDRNSFGNAIRPTFVQQYLQNGQQAY